MPHPANAAAGRATPSSALVLLAYLGFVSLGLPDTVLGVAWPSLRQDFALPQAALGIPLAFSAASYLGSGVLAGRLVRLLGTGGLLAASTALVAAGAAAYAAAPSFAAFLVAAGVVGAGSGAVDSALNSYGAHHMGARHMTWLHAAYSAGAAIGPATMAALVASGAGWRTGYAAVAAALAALAAAFVATRRRWEDEDAGEDAARRGDAGAAREPARPLGAAEALRSRHVPLQIAIFFVYSGTEVAAGQWSYTVLVEARAVDAAVAGAWATGYWASLLAGRVLLGFVVERVGTVRLVRLATAAALAGAAAFAVPGLPTVVGAAGLCLLGFALAPVYPGLMSETPRRVGAAAVHAVGFQVAAATAGVAVIPGAAGLVGERLGLEAIPLAVAACALVLAALHERLVATADRGR